jgi:hypothetical protein
MVGEWAVMAGNALLGCALLLGGACADKGTDSSVPGDGGAADSGEGRTVAVSWTSSGVVLEIQGGFLAGSTFGIAETNPSAADPWTGEDCYHGDTLSDGTHVAWCHEVRDGVHLFQCGGDPASLDAALETAFPCGTAPIVTYLLTDSAGGCWYWGAADGSEYYADLGCTGFE